MQDARRARRASDWLRGFVPGALRVSPAEWLRSCIGAFTGLLLTGLICTWFLSGSPSGSMALPMLIAPMGASTVLLFAVPSSPLAQPWSIIGGNIVSAIIGVSCARWIADPLLAAPAAASLAIGTMIALRCLHPPSGAVALTAVLGGPAVAAAGFHFVLVPVAANSLALTLAALVFNNATRRPYPQPISRAARHGTADEAPLARVGVSRADLDAVLRQRGELLDISAKELERVYQQAEMRAYRRRFGEITCADIMSRDVIAVQFGTPLQEAWSLLRQHGIRILPVLDPARRVLGTISDTDFMASPELDVFDNRWQHFRRLIRRPDTTHVDRPEVVGQLMSRALHTVAQDTPIVELVPLMADRGLRHLPIVDAERRLTGIISQADLVAALYRGSMAEAGAAPAMSP